MQSSCDGRRLITGWERGARPSEGLYRAAVEWKRLERTVQRDKHNNKTYFMFPWRGLQIQGPRIVHAGLLPVLCWHSRIKQSHRLCYQLHLCFFLHNRTICWRKHLCLSRVFEKLNSFQRNRFEAASNRHTKSIDLLIYSVRVYEFHWKYIRNLLVTILNKC